MQQHVSLARGGAGQRRLAWLTRRFGRRPSDLLFRGVTLLLVFIVLALVAGVALVLLINSWPTIQQFGFSFLTNLAFDPVHNVFGVLLAAVPSVIFGLWGFLVLAPWLQQTGEPWLQQHLGFLPFFQGEIHGLGLLAAGMILTIMVLPLIIAVSREVMLVVPTAQREAMLALGATRWEVIRYAVLPFARIGILGGIILALGRALGETMAVTMVIGNQASRPTASLFDTGYTLSSVIANQFGEATPGLFLSALLEAGLIIFIITLITNFLARWLISSLQQKGARA